MSAERCKCSKLGFNQASVFRCKKSHLGKFATCFLAIVLFSSVCTSSTQKSTVSDTKQVRGPVEYRMLQALPIAPAVTEHPYSIIVNWDSFSTSVSSNAQNDFNSDGNKLPSDQVYLACQEAMLKIQSYLAARFTVTAMIEFKLKGQKCSEGRYTLPDVFTKNDGDFLILMNYVSNSGDPNIATSLTCLQDSDTKRPLAGVLNVNLMKITDISAAGKDFLFRRLMHEVFHMIGFSYYSLQSHFAFTVDNSGQFSSQLIGLKGSDVILGYAKEFFQCPTLETVPYHKEEALGDGEIYGSHWSFMHFPYEIMSPSNEIHSRISQFTLKALGDLGWYNIAANSAELYNDGAQETCDAITMEGCPQGEMFCSTDEEGPICSTDRKLKLECATHPLFGSPSANLKCYYKKQLGQSCIDGSLDGKVDKNLEFINNKSSRCFAASSPKAGDPATTEFSVKCLKVKSCALSAAGVYTLSLSTGDNRDFDICQYSADGTLNGDAGFAISADITISCPLTLEGLDDLCPQSLSASGEPVFKTAAPACPDTCESGAQGICMEDYSCFCFFGTNSTTSECLSLPTTTSAAGASILGLFSLLTLLNFLLS